MPYPYKTDLNTREMDDYERKMFEEYKAMIAPTAHVVLYPSVSYLRSCGWPI